MKTSRDFLVQKLLDGKGNICKCCGKQINVTIKQVEHPLRYNTTVINYECDCDMWNEIIKAKKEIEDLNRALQKEYYEYSHKVDKLTKDIRFKYNFDLSKEVWKKELKSIK